MQAQLDSPQQACSSSTQKQLRFCCRCRNHGVRSEFKGHRQQCPYKECSCDECTLVIERRRIIAKQTALKRKQEGKARKEAAAAIGVSSSDTCVMGEEHKGGKKKKKKCSKDLEKFYCQSPSMPAEPTMEPPAAALVNCPSLSSSFSSTSSSSFSPAPSAASSPAMEIINSPAEFTTNDCSSQNMIKIGQVIFRPIEEPETFTQDPYTLPSIYAPTPVTSCVSLCSTVSKDKLDDVMCLPAVNTHIISPACLGSYPSGNTSISTPTAPSYGVAPGVVSSSNISLSKTFPYDNNHSIRPSSVLSPAPAVGYGMMTMQPSMKESRSKMNLLMRVFPEHKPNMIQAVLDSCDGDPIQCIEMILNLQDTERKSDVKCMPVKCESMNKPIMTQAFGTPVVSSGVFSSSLMSGGIPSVVTTYHQSAIQTAPRPLPTLQQEPRPPQAYPEHHYVPSLHVGHQHGPAPVQYVEDTPNPSFPAGTTLAGPLSPFPVRGITSTQVAVQNVASPNTPVLAGSIMCPHQTPSPIQLPHLQVSGVPTMTQDAAPVPSYRLSSPSSSSSLLPSNLHLTPTHTSQMYCQTIGSIQPGKCLSYTSLQAAAVSINASSQTGSTPIIVPVMTESNASQTLKENYYTSQHASSDTGSNSAFSRWQDPTSSHEYPTPTGGTNFMSFLESHQLVGPQETNHAVDAVHALVSLRTTPPRKQQIEVSNPINDLLMEEE